ncbi:UDP-N-acetylglucosamine--N-acetylmuramyl-(pentapeptide) pyrophosphoryl-undecaprenol N-acetylglucosamine transferase [Candidatus Gottesmanbacteria bacterium]|nr:UDP-N-acetylglucosamine--N-acetylmuramyl-(pentapeptide) pyrophosphoryl-undecaprenol N-acetylglucosamine transferase [Candidatus Gottesmanbacteria bacterium]
MINILICGGHLSPALAIIEKIQKDKRYKIYYLGRKSALEGDKAYSLEYNVIKRLNIAFKSIVTGRLQRSITRYSLLSILKIPVGIIQSYYYLVIIKPRVVLSFGGYVSLPICFASWLLRIPIITHEQTSILGLANNIISRLSRILCTSFKDTQGIPKRVNVLYTGNPIRQSIFKDEDNNILGFGNNSLPLIYITGGNMGSRVINETVGEIIQMLSRRYRILHQCGNADNEKDYKYLSNLKNNLPAYYIDNYKVIEQIDPYSIGTIYRNAKLIIGRGGANTVNEILAFGITAIIIPLPWSGQDEQKKNALNIQSAGLGEVINQEDLTPEVLLRAIDNLQNNTDINRQKFIKNQRIVQNAIAGKIVNLINSYCA